eukprot:scaffold122487_cov42-Phaeocystis_antarctica.AAC.1
MAPHAAASSPGQGSGAGSGCGWQWWIRSGALAFVADAHDVLIGHEDAREQVQLLLGARVRQDPLVREVRLHVHLLAVLARLLVLVLATDALEHRAGRLGRLRRGVALRVGARLLLHLRLDLVRLQLRWHRYARPFARAFASGSAGAVARPPRI